MEIHSYIIYKDLDKALSHICDNPCELYHDDVFELICAEGNIECAKKFVEKGYSINFPNVYFSKSLGYGYIEFSKWIYENYKDSISDEDCEYGAKLACYNGYIESLNWLINIISFEHLCDQYFYSACINGHKNISEYLIEKCSNDITQNVLQSALLYSCSYGQLEIAEWIYELIDDPKIEQPFYESCKKNFVQVAEWLDSIYNGFNKEIICDVFDISCKNGCLGIIEWLHDKYINFLKEHIDDNKNNIFLNLCKSNNVQAVQWIINKYDNVWCQWNSALLTTYRRGSLNMIKFILNKCPDCVSHLPYIFENICKTNTLTIVEWVYKHVKDDIKLDKDHIHHLLNDVIYNNNINVAIWICDTFKVKYPQDIIDHAIFMGRIDFIEKAIPESDIENFYLYAFNKCYTDKGSKKVAKWVYEKYLKHNKTFNYSNSFCTACICGELNIAKWIYSIAPSQIESLPNLSNILQTIIFTNNGYSVTHWFLTTPKIVENIDLMFDNNVIFRELCRNGDIQNAKKIIKMYPDLSYNIINDKCCEDGQTSVEEACVNNQLHIVKWIYDIHPKSLNIVNTSSYVYDQINSKNYSEEYFELIKWITELFPDNYQILNDDTWRKIPEFVIHEGKECSKEFLKECSICYEKPDVISDCDHLLCLSCAKNVNRYGLICPMCRKKDIKFYNIN